MKRAAVPVLCFVFLVAATRRRAVAPPTVGPVNIVINRSMVLTDPAVIDGITLQRVLEALIDRAGVNMTPLDLYKQWFDTQNPKPGMFVADAPHCDDFITDGKPSFNGYVRRCPTPEGILATTDPFLAHDYVTLGVINRFDQTPADGSNCGQYRIIFERRDHNVATSKVDVIFEGVLPNPNPPAGIFACRAVAQYWADLSNVDSALERRTRVERFFFDGIPGFEPLLMQEHLTNGGRVRNKHVTSAHAGIPRFYQFLVEKRCSGSNCRLVMQPDVLENATFGALYDASLDTPYGTQFREEFIRAIPTLALKDINYYVNFSKQALLVESDPSDDFITFAAGPPYGHGVATSQAGKDFDARVRAELARIGSTLTPQQLTARADTQHCTGCHLGGTPIGDGMLFPRASNDSHVTPSGMSQALQDVFAPNRAKILRDFLMFGTPPPVHVN